MSKISFGYSSYGTVYGTVRSYDVDGVDLGARNITSDGLFFIVRESFSAVSQVLFRKSIGTGVTVTDGPNGKFVIAVQSTDNKRQFGEYAYNMFISNDTNFIEGTTQLKSVGSGIYEILEGPGYGTLS